MSQLLTPTAVASANQDYDNPPILPLTQDNLAAFPFPPPLPPPKNDVEVDVRPDLFPPKEDASVISDHTPTVEAIVVNDSSTCGAGDTGWEQYFRQKIKYKGKDVCALNILFLQSPGQHPEIPSNLYMNEVITSVPWHDCQEYGIVWDYTALPIALDKSAICHAISKTNQQCINLLKMARFVFDRVHPDGVKGVPNIAPMTQIREKFATNA